MACSRCEPRFSRSVLGALADASQSGQRRAYAAIAAAAALQAEDGVALKVMVDRWAAAIGENRGLAYEAAFVRCVRLRSVLGAS